MQIDRQRMFYSKTGSMDQQACSNPVCSQIPCQMGEFPHLFYKCFGITWMSDKLKQ